MAELDSYMGYGGAGDPNAYPDAALRFMPPWMRAAQAQGSPGVVAGQPSSSGMPGGDSVYSRVAPVTPSPSNAVPGGAPPPPPVGGSYIDRLMAPGGDLAGIKQREAELASRMKAGVPTHKASRAEIIASLILAGTQGWASRSPEAGFEASQGLLNRSKNEARRKWQEETMGMERDLSGARSTLQEGMALSEAQSREAERAAMVTERGEMSKYRQGQLDREKARDLQTSQWHADELTRQRERDTITEQHWADEIKEKRADRAARLGELKDARTGVQYLRMEISGDDARLGSIDRRIASIDSSPFNLLKDSPMLQERNDLMIERNALKKERDEVSGLIKKHLGIDHDAGKGGSTPQLSPPPSPPGPPAAGMKWQYNRATQQFRQVPVTGGQQAPPPA